LALARPSSPAIATVFQVYAFAVPLASRTAKSRGPGAVGLGVALGLGAVAMALGVVSTVGVEVGACACLCPQATDIKSRAISSRLMQR